MSLSGGRDNVELICDVVSCAIGCDEMETAVELNGKIVMKNRVAEKSFGACVYIPANFNKFNQFIRAKNNKVTGCQIQFNRCLLICVNGIIH